MTQFCGNTSPFALSTNRFQVFNSTRRSLRFTMVLLLSVIAFAFALLHWFAAGMLRHGINTALRLVGAGDGIWIYRRIISAFRWASDCWGNPENRSFALPGGNAPADRRLSVNYLRAGGSGRNLCGSGDQRVDRCANHSVDQRGDQRRDGDRHISLGTVGTLCTERFQPRRSLLRLTPPALRLKMI